MTAVSWDGGGDGVTWNSPNNWSSNQLPTASDDVSLPAGSLVTLAGSDADVHSLTTARPLTVNGVSLTIHAGGVTFGGATRVIAYGHVNVTGDVTINSTTLTLGDSADNSGGFLNIDGAGSASILGNGTISGAGSGGEVVNRTFDGSAGNQLTLASTLAFAGSNLHVYSSFGGLGILNNANINLAGTHMTIGGRFVNNGAIAVSGSLGSLSATNLINNAGKTISATTGATLALDGDFWDNNGVLSVNNATLYLGGNFTFADVGTLSRTGGSVIITGLLDNTGLTFTPSGTWTLQGELLNGTLAGGGGGSNILVVAGGTLNGVTINAPISCASNNAIHFADGTTLNSTLTLGSAADASGGFLYVEGATDQTLAGTGSIVGAGGGGSIVNNTYDGVSSGLQLTIASTLSITGQSLWLYSNNAGGTILCNTSLNVTDGSWNISGPFINNASFTLSGAATLSATNIVNNPGEMISVTGTATLFLGGDGWDNNGTLSLGATGTLNFGGNFTFADVGSFNRAGGYGGTVNLSGVLDNTSMIFTPIGTWNLSGTLLGGTLAGGGINMLVGGGGTLDGVIVDAPISAWAFGSFVFTDDTLLNSTLTLGSGSDDSSGSLYVNGTSDQTLGGTGSIVGAGAGGAVYNNTWDEISSGLGLTIAASLTLTGHTLQIYDNNPGGTILSHTNLNITDGAWAIGGPYTNDASITISNDGSLTATDLVNNPGRTLSVSGPADLTLLGDEWDNNGTISLNNAALNLGGNFTAADIGTLNRSGGNVLVSGSLDNTGNTLTPIGVWDLVGTVLGGTLGGSGPNVLAGVGGTLDGVTVAGTVVATLNNVIVLSDNTVVNGTIRLGDDSDNSGGYLYVNGSNNATLGGTGSIVGAGAGGTVYNNTWDGVSHGLVLTLAAGLTFSGKSLNFSPNNPGGTIVDNATFNATGGTWSTSSISANNGTMQVGGGGTTLTVNAANFANPGTITVAAGGTLTTTGNLSSAGTLSVAGKLHVNGQLNATAGSTINSPASGVGVIRCTNLLLGSGVSLDLHDNDLIVDYSGASPIGTWNGSAYTGLIGQVVAGRTGNPGITSSSASGSFEYLAVAEAKDALGLAVGGGANFDGDEFVDATCVLIKFTYGGDANLDGTINVDDYGKIDFNVPLGTRFWFNGDFNYDGKINVDDYGIIDSNVSIQGPPAAAVASPSAPAISMVSATPSAPAANVFASNPVNWDAFAPHDDGLVQAVLAE